MAHGFPFLVAILDIASRKVLAFRLSNTLTPDYATESALTDGYTLRAALGSRHANT
jgi:hypothetical protein